MSVQLPLQGIWLPLITPFINGQIDEPSLRKLLGYYSGKGLSGFVLAATTGEGQLLSSLEINMLVRVCADELENQGAKLPIWLGLSGSDPTKISSDIVATQGLPIDGYHVCGPLYLRPTQKGIMRFYADIAEVTKREILIYNIPYRSGVNINNETMFELAQIPNIVGVKDCCGSSEQSYELIRSSPSTFSVLTGEDPFFFNAMVHGAPGAILTGAHVLANFQIAIRNHLCNGNSKLALDMWNQISHIPALLFAEPSPAPLKYWLWRKGLIASPELRTPFLPISATLSKKLDQASTEFEYLAEKYRENNECFCP